MHHRSHDWGVSAQGVSVLGESLSWGVSVQGQSLSMEGLCPGGSLSRGVSVRETPLYSNEQAVSILLECILVTSCNKVVAR